MAELTRKVINPDSTGNRPLETALQEAKQDPMVMALLAPLPKPASSGSSAESSTRQQPQKRPRSQPPQPKAGGNKQRRFGQRVPTELVGLSPRSKDGAPICFAFNLKGCEAVTTDDKCPKGLHVCMRCGSNAHGAAKCSRRRERELEASEVLHSPANESLIRRDDSREERAEVSASTPTLLLMGADHTSVVSAFEAMGRRVFSMGCFRASSRRKAINVSMSDESFAAFFFHHFQVYNVHAVLMSPVGGASSENFSGLYVENIEMAANFCLSANSFLLCENPQGSRLWKLLEDVSTKCDCRLIQFQVALCN